LFEFSNPDVPRCYTNPDCVSAYHVYATPLATGPGRASRGWHLRPVPRQHRRMVVPLPRLPPYTVPLVRTVGHRLSANWAHAS
jgi:hypothetical protein